MGICGYELKLWGSLNFMCIMLLLKILLMGENMWYFSGGIIDLYYLFIMLMLKRWLVLFDCFYWININFICFV